MVDDFRYDEEHDVDRILYSSAFRRLAGVTQVVAVGETALFHNRLTHTIKVAQLARRLAQDLNRDPALAAAREAIGGINEGAAEAAALAHDIGHPPFGHIAEAVLDKLATEAGVGGFEGNAQSFRIVTKLAQRKGPGLQLHPRTLNGILKYPWLRLAEKPPDTADKALRRKWKKWGAYQPEAALLTEARAGDESENKSAEAALMDWCDDISYALHDFEDFYRLGVIPVDQVVNSEDDRNRFLLRVGGELADDPEFDAEEAVKAFKSLKDLLPDEPYRGDDDARRELHNKTSFFIGDYLAAVTLQPGAGCPVTIDKRKRHEVLLLKQLTWQYVVNDPALASIQRGQVDVIENLATALSEWMKSDCGKLQSNYRIPAGLRRIYDHVKADPVAQTVFDSEEKFRTRAVVDYVASLTESQAVDLYARLSGTAAPSILEDWLRF